MTIGERISQVFQADLRVRVASDYRITSLIALSDLGKSAKAGIVRDPRFKWDIESWDLIEREHLNCVCLEFTGPGVC
jgi:hypothetical protein